jgi:hypothetical protein
MTFNQECGFTGTTRTFASSDAFDEKSRFARIHGGMHFKFAAVAGEEPGKRVAQWWVAARHFGRLLSCTLPRVNSRLAG